MQILAKLSLFLLILVPISSYGEELEKITVRNRKNEIIRVISSTSHLAKFRKAWSKKVRHDVVLPRSWEFKLDLSPGDRWLYDPEGWVVVLSKTESSILPNRSTC